MVNIKIINVLLLLAGPGEYLRVLFIYFLTIVHLLQGGRATQGRVLLQMRTKGSKTWL